MTLFWVVINRELVGSQWLEVGDISGVLCNSDSTWVVGVAVVPCSELVAFAWECFDDSGIVVAGVWRGDIRLAHAVVVGLDGEDIGGYFVDWVGQCSPIGIGHVCLFASAYKVDF